MSFDICTLSDYITVQGGYAYKSSDFIEYSPYSVLRIKNVGFGKVLYSDTAYISKELAENTLKWKVYEGDLLISMTGSNFNAPNSLVGRVARVWEKNTSAWINQRVGRIQVNGKNLIDLDFIYYFLSQKEIQHLLVANSTGSGNQANISAKIIESIPCPKIDFITSKKISSVLIDLDRKIIKNHQINETLEAMAQAIFKSWFVDFDPVHAKAEAKAAGKDDAGILRAAMAVIASKSEQALAQMAQDSPDEYKKLEATAKAFPDAFVESELGLIPEGWEVSSFAEFVKIKKGKNITKSRVLPGEVPVVAGGLEPAYYHNAYNVKGPAITISASGANAGYVNMYYQNIWSSDSSYIDKDATSYLFSAYVLLKKRQKEIFSMQTGAAQPHIYPKDFERLMLVIPDRFLLKSLEINIKSYFNFIEKNKKENKTLTELRDSLLPKLLSGEIEV